MLANCAKSSYEFTVVASESQRPTELLCVSLPRPLLDSYNFGWIGSYSVLTDYVTQILRISERSAFAPFDV
jgi:hypothetical protein